MRKFKFIALCFAAVTAVSLMCSCGSKKDKDKDDDDDKKTEKVDKKAEKADKQVGMGSSQSFNLEDFNATMDYLEANASSFFPRFNSLMKPVRKALDTNVPPSDSEAKQLESFVSANQRYFEAVGALIGHEEAGQLTEEEIARTEKFAQKYSEGLENVGILIGIGMQGDN